MESGFQKVQKENFFGSGSLCSKGRGSVTHLAASTIPRVGEKKQEVTLPPRGSVRKGGDLRSHQLPLALTEITFRTEKLLGRLKESTWMETGWREASMTVVPARIPGTSQALP